MWLDAWYPRSNHNHEEAQQAYDLHGGGLGYGDPKYWEYLRPNNGNGYGDSFDGDRKGGSLSDIMGRAGDTFNGDECF